ncbi:hypothetical protein IFM89_000583 [Coptis chinensis]|uniref:PSD13 N-terminal domain-containing protein n=1 Tax=Coptis chinensis TaxID=261450 RepID=A0A835LHZ5_9MAGN|nr:hypothetical protein IFM89_000583 [Coptis chinensis]
MAGLQYLDSQRESHPELAEWYTELADLYERKLWHQLALKLDQLISLPIFQAGNVLIDLYNNFITEFETSRYKGIANSGANTLLQIAEIAFRLEKGDQKDCKNLLDDGKTTLDSMTDIDPFVYASYYWVSSQYHKCRREFSEFLWSALLYLVYTWIEKDRQLDWHLWDRQCEPCERHYGIGNASGIFGIGKCERCERHLWAWQCERCEWHYGIGYASDASGFYGLDNASDIFGIGNVSDVSGIYGLGNASDASGIMGSAMQAMQAAFMGSAMQAALWDQQCKRQLCDCDRQLGGNSNDHQLERHFFPAVIQRLEQIFLFFYC